MGVRRKSSRWGDVCGMTRKRQIWKLKDPGLAVGLDAVAVCFLQCVEASTAISARTSCPTTCAIPS